MNMGRSLGNVMRYGKSVTNKERIMKSVSRVAFVLVLLSLAVSMTTSSVMAQDSPFVDPGQLQPQVAREVVSSWDGAHPLEFYLALPVIEYLAIAQMPSVANVHPLEYYLAFPVGSQVAQESDNLEADMAMEPGQ